MKIHAYARRGAFVLPAALHLRLTCLAMGAAPPTPTPEPKAQKKGPRYPKAPSDKGVKLYPDAWKTAPVKAVTPAEIDALLTKAQKADKITPAPLAPDDVFFRRVHLDLVGRTPSPSALRDFLADKDPQKRAKLIDKLLDSSEFSRVRARYWRNVLLSRATDDRIFVRIPRGQALEVWLVEQFRAKKSWKEISRALITAEGELQLSEPRKNGQVGMMLAHAGEDGPPERTNDTVRAFLGINLQCAQCHDHPDDIWKRQQFHEMAAFYGMLGERVRLVQREPLDFATRLSRRFGEYRMPDRDDPRKRSAVRPKFLTGEAPEGLRSDPDRRKALADYVTAEGNYYFAAAFVNRVWADLLGQGFVMPVDNLGPLQPGVYPDVLVRLASSFRATDYDIRALYRTILNTQAYQRQARVPDGHGEHVRFAGVSPTRLPADALWDSLTEALGPMAGPGGGPGRFRGFFSPQRAFRSLFAFDPSSKPEDGEGSVPQALMMMNNVALNAKIRASGDTPLAKILKEYPKDDAAVEQVYLLALGRRPTARELKVSLAHVKKVGDRG